MTFHTWLMASAALVSVSAFGATGYQPTFDPSRLKGAATGLSNEVAVLGTIHLSGLPANFDSQALTPLIDRLAAWKPQIITTEALSGAQCDFMRSYSARYADSVKRYCWDPTPARNTTGLDVPAATAEVYRLLAAGTSALTAAQRRHLAAVFLAAGERTSALVQWLRLAPPERQEGDGLDRTLVNYLQTLASKHDEDFMIAAPLAARLGLDRVYPVDDHTADTGSSDEADDKVAGETMQRIWDNPANARLKIQAAALRAKLGNDGGLLALYQAYNQSERAQLVYDADFGAAMKDRSTQKYGRSYVGYWETRNLRMVSNIRDILGRTPGTRLLAIVGASHKGYFEAYLNMMHDVKLSDMQAILR